MLITERNRGEYFRKKETRRIDNVYLGLDDPSQSTSDELTDTCLLPRGIITHRLKLELFRSRSIVARLSCRVSALILLRITRTCNSLFVNGRSHARRFARIDNTRTIDKDFAIFIAVFEDTCRNETFSPRLIVSM